MRVLFLFADIRSFFKRHRPLPEHWKDGFAGQVEAYTVTAPVAPRLWKVVERNERRKVERAGLG